MKKILLITALIVAINFTSTFKLSAQDIMCIDLGQTVRNISYTQFWARGVLDSFTKLDQDIEEYIVSPMLIQRSDPEYDKKVQELIQSNDEFKAKTGLELPDEKKVTRIQKQFYKLRFNSFQTRFEGQFLTSQPSESTIKEVNIEVRKIVSDQCDSIDESSFIKDFFNSGMEYFVILDSSEKNAISIYNKSDLELNFGLSSFEDIINKLSELNPVNLGDMTSYAENSDNGMGNAVIYVILIPMATLILLLISFYFLKEKFRKRF